MRRYYAMLWEISSHGTTSIKPSKIRLQWSWKNRNGAQIVSRSLWKALEPMMIIRFARYYIGSGQFASAVAATLEWRKKNHWTRSLLFVSIYAYIVQSILLRTYNMLLCSMWRNLSQHSSFALHTYASLCRCIY